MSELLTLTPSASPASVLPFGLTARPAPAAIARSRPLCRRLSTLEFARRHVKFDGKEIDPAVQWPWIVEPIEFSDRIRGGTFLFKASIQSMKSGAAELINLRQMCLRPVRAIWYFPTDKACSDFASEKWNPLLDNCAPFQKVLYENPHKRTTLAIDLPFGHFRMCSAGVTMNRNSKSACDLTLDEAWEYEPGWLTDILGRNTSYRLAQLHRVIIPTSGEDLGSEVNEIWDDSDQRTWHSRCPQCHADFPADFRFAHELDRPGGLRFERSEKVLHANGTLNTVALAATVRLQCPHCRTEFPYTPALQSRLNDPAHAARHLPLNPNPKPLTHAWNWNSLVNISWPELAEEQFKAELAQARGDLSKIEVFARKRAARTYSESAFIKLNSDLTAERGTYALGAEALTRPQPKDSADLLPIPAPDKIAPAPHGPPAFCTLTIDVQQSHYWYLVRAWWPDLVSQLVEYGKALSTGELRDIQKKYGIKDHGGRIEFDEQANQFILPEGCGVYLDGNYNPAQVRRLAAAYNWCVFRGDDCKEFRHKDGFFRIYSEINVIDAFEGTGAAGARYVPEIRFANTPARNRLALIRSIDQPRRLWTFAKDADKTYTNHLGAWARIEKKSPKSNQTIHEWKQVADRDDLFWCEKASVVIASMAGLIGVSEGTKGEEEKPDSPQ